MQFVDQWREIEPALPNGWSSARLSLSVAEETDPDRAALILASLTPGRTGPSFRLVVRPDRNPETIFRRLDREGIRGRVDLVGTEERPVEQAQVAPRRADASLVAQWDELATDLPPDWSEVYAELELSSSDFISRAALLMAPVNPARYGALTVLRFRVASRTGYGTAAEMARRCMERLDAERITGSLRALRVLSHTAHVATQGPVWRVGGRSV
ncbi:MAG TPA: hypothetical protein VFG61_05365 [Gaiellaceae bacterium]|jgi:hypothetical protein|nr:hypothetical protein [Gaiellaceae bacterium]